MSNVIEDYEVALAITLGLVMGTVAAAIGGVRLAMFFTLGWAVGLGGRLVVLYLRERREDRALAAALAEMYAADERRREKRYRRSTEARP